HWKSCAGSNIADLPGSKRIPLLPVLNFSHAGSPAAVGTPVRMKLAQVATIWSASACDAGLRSGAFIFDVFEKFGKNEFSSDECTAPSSNFGSGVAGIDAPSTGALRSAKSR